MKKLSSFKNIKKLYAFCSNCKQLFIDDLILAGTIYCPICNKYALHRGYNENEIKTIKDSVFDKVEI